MSVTVTAIPFFLLAKVVIATAGLAQAEALRQSVMREKEENSGQFHIAKKIETNFMDKELLTKTLVEHGVEELSFVGNYISCKVGEHVLRFSKANQNTPYILEILGSPKTILNCEETVDDMINEYAQNVQEATYYKIKERLEENNMQIDEEEILEDNSIVLTVNIN